MGGQIATLVCCLGSSREEKQPLGLVAADEKQFLKGEIANSEQLVLRSVVCVLFLLLKAPPSRAAFPPDFEPPPRPPPPYMFLTREKGAEVRRGDSWCLSRYSTQSLRRQQRILQHVCRLVVSRLPIPNDESWLEFHARAHTHTACTHISCCYDDECVCVCVRMCVVGTLLLMALGKHCVLWRSFI